MPTSYYTTEDADGDGSQSFTLVVHNNSGAWISVDIDRSTGVVPTGHIPDGETRALTEMLQLYANYRNRVTRWRPGRMNIAGNAGGQILFSVPEDAFDIFLEVEVRG
ncbi:MAG: hypothetical protein ABJE66_27260 [Deltaproteobacteria bacterium]